MSESKIGINEGTEPKMSGKASTEEFADKSTLIRLLGKNFKVMYSEDPSTAHCFVWRLEQVSKY